MTDPKNDPHGKKGAWRSLLWSFLFAVLILLAGFGLLWAAHYLDSPVLAFLGLAALVGGFLQPLGHAVFDLFAAYVWRPMWEHKWFQWVATAILLAIVALAGWAALFSQTFN